MARLKPLLPTLREKKRYLVFEIVSKGKKKAFSAVSKALWNAMHSFAGTVSVAQAGLWFLPEKYNEDLQRGIARVNHRSVDTLRASLLFVQEIEGQPVVARSVVVSGSLKKASKRVAG